MARNDPKNDISNQRALNTPIMDSERSNKSSGFSELNESLLIEILSRLPCREATRFKLVCKHWNSLSSSDYFISLFNHRCHDPSVPSESPSLYRLLLDFRYTYEYCTASDFSLVVHFGPGGAVLRKHKLDLSFLPCRPIWRLRVNASFGDFILCSYYDKNTKSTNFYLRNPQTEQWVVLPSIHLLSRPDLDEYIAGLLCVPAPCFFCQHGNGGGVISNKFKFMVVLISIFKPGESVTTQIEVVLFSSDQGRWRNHAVSSPVRLNHGHYGNVVSYNGKLHWFSYPYVLVYDPYDNPNRISRVIELGTNCRIPSPIVLSIAVFHDRLRIVFSTDPFYPSKHNQVWELEDYNVGTWRLVHEVRYTGPEKGHVLHDGNALCLEPISKPCGRVSSLLHRAWLCRLRNGAVDKGRMYELVLCHQDFSLYSLDVYQIANLLPTPLPPFEWPHS